MDKNNDTNNLIKKPSKILQKMTPQEMRDYLKEDPFATIWITKINGGKVESFPVLVSEYYKEYLKENNDK